MPLQRSRLETLLVGADRRRTRLALVAAAAAVAAAALLEYLALRSGHEGPLEAVHLALVLDGAGLAAPPHGEVVVFALAAAYAALNVGYLVSVLLGWSVSFGAVLWTIGSRTGVANLTLDPAAAVGRTSPEAIVVATAGFAVGVALRRAARGEVLPGAAPGRT